WSRKLWRVKRCKERPWKHTLNNEKKRCKQLKTRRFESVAQFVLNMCGQIMINPPKSAGEILFSIYSELISVAKLGMSFYPLNTAGSSIWMWFNMRGLATTLPSNGRAN